MKIIQFFENKIRNFSRQFVSDKIIVGLSGGADSVALLVSLRSVGCECVAAHCNFMLRGEESERDMNHAREIAYRTGAEFVSIRFDVPEYMSNHKCSLETACRELRYSWFQELCREMNAAWIAVGHHREDNVETFFLNLFRGTGIRGLKGMRPVNANIIRPLLSFTRDEIELYLKEKGVDFITDSSNNVADVARNRIRNTLMPVIRHDFPNADKSISTTISNLYATETFVKEMISRERDEWVNNGVIDISGIVKKRESASYIIFELLNELGFNSEQSRDIIRCVLSSATGKTFVNNTGEIYCLDRGKLVPMSQANNEYRIITEIISINDFTPGQNPFIEYFDLSILDGEPLKVRKWQLGDRMKTFGMKSGSRLISDIMRDAGYSLVDKDNTRLLVKGDDILWVIGLRRSNSYLVNRKSSEILRITAVSELPSSQ